MRPRNFADPFRWYEDFSRDAWRSGNEQSQQLAHLYRQIYRTNQEDQVSGLCEEGIKIARQLAQPFWELFFRVRRYQIGHDYGDVTDELIQMSIDISQPALENCPYNVLVYRELLFAYSVSDPLGHADNILEGCAYVEQSMPVDEDTYIQLPEFRYRVYDSQRQWSLALESAQEYLARAQESQRAFHIVIASMLLTQHHFELGLPHLAIESIGHAERVARQERQGSWLKTVMRWYLPLYMQVNNERALENVKKELRLLEKEQTFMQGVMAIVAYDKVANKIVDLMTDHAILIEKADQFNDRVLEIDLSIEYYGYLKSSSMWQRWTHFGALDIRRTKALRMLANFREEFPQMRWVLLPVFYIILILSGLRGDLINRKVPKVRQHILSLIESSPAKAQYESRLKRIESGDFTHLS